jgi:Asp-tRNA(Asn)/Glu-tRNA(Gln) amidotransferase A subunit family amidase
VSRRPAVGVGHAADPGDGPASWSASQVATAIRAGDITSEEVVGACLERIAARDADVHAWTYVDPDAALTVARQRDAADTGGPLHGVPVGIKDLIDTVDAPTAYGSPIHAGHRPARDAACVARLREAGAVLLGKTVTTEFALFHPGPTANPHDLARTPGGSSSGSAAAVADHMVPVALGTQTAGSIIRPAAFCGIHGFKPTFGTIPTDGVRAIGPSLDTIGPLARSVADLALTAGVMAGRDLTPDTADRPSVAFARTWEWEQADPTTRDAIDAAARRLGLPQVDLPAPFADLADAQAVIMDAEVAVALEPEHRSQPRLLSDELRDMLDRGRAVSAEELRHARDHAARCRTLLASVFADHDALLVPSAIGEAPAGLDATGDPLFCRIWTLLGTPTVAVPSLRGPHGLPLGVQVVADRHGDRVALAAASWIGDELQQEAP